MVNAADCLYADAFAFFDQGACHDEEGDVEEAKNMYNQGLELVKQGSKTKDAQKSELYKGVMETQAKILERIGELKTKAQSKEKVQKIREALDSAGTGDAELLYWLPEGVQLVTIEGETTAAQLILLRLPYSDLTSFARCIYTGWTVAYPLISGKTTVLKNELGFMLCQTRPQNIQTWSVLKTSEIVEQMSTEERQRTSERISQFLIKSGEILAQNVTRAASKTGDKHKSSDSTWGLCAPQRQQNGCKSHQNLLDKIGDIGVSVGKKVASGVSGESTGGRFLQSTATVVGGGITGVSTVWISLEDASKTLFRSFADETVQTVHAKYGEQASETTHHALYAAGHTTLAGFQLWDLGPRSIAGRMARKAGIQVVTSSCRAPSTSNIQPQLSADSVKGNSHIQEK
uniref:MIT domain-containing protein n=1 Tax=Ditylenchus dipsaci TaxID=166011 RepID=A0A915DEX9_9BILA